MTLTYIIIVAAVVVLAVIVSRFVFRGDPRDEVDQFHRARTMTTNWSQQHQTGQGGEAPYPATEEQQPDAPAPGKADDRQRR